MSEILINQVVVPPSPPQANYLSVYGIANELYVMGPSGVSAVVRGVTGVGVQGVTGAGSAIRLFSWVITAPAVGGIPGPQVAEAHTAQRISSYVTTAATTATFNVEHRAAIGSAGSDLLAADQVAGTTGASSTALQLTGVAADHWLWLDISAVSAIPPAALVVTLKTTV